MATISTYNFPDHYKGDTLLPIVFSLKDSTNPPPYPPVSLENATAKCQFRKDNEKGTLVKELTTAVDGGLEITDAAGGVLTMEGFVIDWTAGIYYYDIEFTFTSGVATVVKTYIRGTITVVQDVTKTV